MNSKLYSSLKSVFGYSYSKVLAVLTYQFDKEKKQSVIIEETSVNSASNTNPTVINITLEKQNFLF